MTVMGEIALEKLMGYYEAVTGEMLLLGDLWNNSTCADSELQFSVFSTESREGEHTGLSSCSQEFMGWPTPVLTHLQVFPFTSSDFMAGITTII